VGGRRKNPGKQSFVHAATRSGLVLFIVAAAQSLPFILTLQQVPHMVGDMMLALSKSNGVWLFMLLSIAVLMVMGSVFEGAAALIIFAPLLLPVAVKPVSISCISAWCWSSRWASGCSRRRWA
jgi:TRAP-type C4-dicarboxylate transport system permease large subunit